MRYLTDSGSTVHFILIEITFVQVHLNYLSISESVLGNLYTDQLTDFEMKWRYNTRIPETVSVRWHTDFG